MENTTKPQTLPPKMANIPLELKTLPRWVLWRMVQVGEESSPRWSKLPMQANGQPASSTNPSSWTDFVTVEHAYESNPDKFDGIGFVFSNADNLIGIDLDDCLDPVTHQFINPASQDIATRLNGYMEISPSGTGVKIFTRATLPSAHVDHSIGLEVYPHSKIGRAHV